MAISQIQAIGPRSEQVAQKKDKKSDIEKIIEGLQVAQGITGIGVNIQSIRDHQSNMEARDQDTGIKAVQEMDAATERSRFLEGRLSKGDQIKLGTQGFVPAQPGQAPDFKATDDASGGPLGYVKRQSAPAVRPPSPMEEQRLKLAQQEFEYKKQHDASEGARKAEKAPTDVQIGAAGYAKRALAADSITNDLLSKGYDPTTIGAGIRGNVPLIGNFVRSDEDKQFGQAKNDFISAVLRKESGAAISKDEYKNEDLKYFPQPGDTPKVIAQKSESRQRAIATLEAQGGTGLEKVTTVPVKGSAAPAVGTTKQPAALPGSVIEYEGVQYQVGPKGELTPLSGNKP